MPVGAPLQTRQPTREIVPMNAPRREPIVTWVLVILTGKVPALRHHSATFTVISTLFEVGVRLTSA